jgi:hypothetical protein
LAKSPQAWVLKTLFPVVQDVGVALNWIPTDSPEASLSEPVAACAVMTCVVPLYEAVQLWPPEVVNDPVTLKSLDWNAAGTWILTIARPMVLEAVHGATSELPQLWTVSVHEPDVFPVAVGGTMDVTLNSLTDAGPFALLACGARTSAPVSSKIDAANENRPRHERLNFDKDMA